MSSRRSFIKNSVFTAMTLPLAGEVPTKETYSLRQLEEVAHLSETDYWKQVRMQFPLKEGQTYFNNATLGPQPGYVLNKVIEEMHTVMVHAAETDYKGQGPELISGYFKCEELRTKVGALINADYKEIALTQNATFGMNFIANGLDLEEGDELINTNLEHGGGFAAWQQLAKRKACIYKQAEIKIPANDPQEIIDSILREVTPKTKIIAIPHIVSAYGIVLPVKEICQIAREKGIFTVIDGAQAVGQIPVDVKDLGCDAYYSSLHKWLLAPGGNGLLYVRQERMPELWATLASYNWENQEDHGFRLMQYGTGNPALLVGLEAAVDFYTTIGPERWFARIKFLGDYLREGLKSIRKITIHSSVHPAMCAGITTYSFEGISGPDLQKRLWEKGRLQPRSIGHPVVRHSVHIYNLETELDKTLEILSEL